MGDYGKYCITPVEDMISIKGIVTIHYFEFASNYVFQGEKHDFWEFLYVDKGEVEITADVKGYKLQKGDIVFHKPNEFHSVWANGRIAPNIIVVSFECRSPRMDFFENKILALSAQSRNILAEILKEGRNTFKNNFSGPYNKLIKRSTEKTCSEQLVKIYLELLLLQIMREDNSVQNKDRLYSAAKERVEEDTINNIIDYMENNTCKCLSFNDICSKFYMGKTRLKTMFKAACGMGVMEYFMDLKIDEAKRLIREGKKNFTEISQDLSFNSLYYFSRCFKKHTGMTPTEYAASIKAKAQL